jgi:hypothetical protein
MGCWPWIVSNRIDYLWIGLPIAYLKTRNLARITFYLEEKMKLTVYGSILVLLALLSLPTTSDAFSRRSKGSDFVPTQAVTTPAGTTQNVSAQSVPEPPVLLLMSIAFGVFALYSAVRAFRKQS